MATCYTNCTAGRTLGKLLYLIGSLDERLGRVFLVVRSKTREINTWKKRYCVLCEASTKKELTKCTFSNAL